LIHFGVRSADTDWEHRFVAAEFASKLIRRRKIFSGSLGEVFRELFEIRIQGDYRPDDVAERSGGYAFRRAEKLVSEAAKTIEAPQLAEAPAEYGADMKTGKKLRKPEELVEEARAILLSHYPDLDIRIKKRGDRDFTIEAFGDYPEMWQVSHCLGAMPTDALVDDDVWIVVLGLPRRDN
jgi:hypothetical protein